LKIIDFIFIVCDEFESFNSAISILKRVPSYNFEKSKNPYKDKMELRIQKLLVSFFINRFSSEFTTDTNFLYSDKNSGF